MGHRTGLSGSDSQQHLPAIMARCSARRLVVPFEVTQVDRGSRMRPATTTMPGPTCRFPDHLAEPHALPHARRPAAPSIRNNRRSVSAEAIETRSAPGAPDPRPRQLGGPFSTCGTAAHPGCTFLERAHGLGNWTSVFAGVPDFRARLLATCREGNVEWGEVGWRGHHTDRSPFAGRGSSPPPSATTRSQQAACIEPVEHNGADDPAVEQLYCPPHDDHRLPGRTGPRPSVHAGSSSPNRPA